MANITVVGGGSVATAIALELQSKGHRIDLVAEKLPGNKQITSDLAAGIGCIFKPSSPFVGQLVLDSYEDFMRLAHDEHCGAIETTKLHVVTASDKMPDWASRVKDYTIVNEHRATYDTYSFNPGMLGKWRMQILSENGVTLQERKLDPYEIAALRDGQKLQGSDYTVLATGLATRDYLPELKLYPVRGILVHYPEPRIKGPSHSFMNEETAAYVVNRPGGPIVGGTFEEGIGSCNDTEKIEIGRRITENVIQEFSRDGLNSLDFNFSLRNDITAGYRPAVHGNPIMEYGDHNKRVAVVTGFGGQGWVTGFEVARRVAQQIEENMYPRVSTV